LHVNINVIFLVCYPILGAFLLPLPQSTPLNLGLHTQAPAAHAPFVAQVGTHFWVASDIKFQNKKPQKWKKKKKKEKKEKSFWEFVLLQELQSTKQFAHVSLPEHWLSPQSPVQNEKKQITEKII
jgi:hypothetical protein